MLNENILSSLSVFRRLVQRIVAAKNAKYKQLKASTATAHHAIAASVKRESAKQRVDGLKTVLQNALNLNEEQLDALIKKRREQAALGVERTASVGIKRVVAKDVLKELDIDAEVVDDTPERKKQKKKKRGFFGMIKRSGSKAIKSMKN